MRQGISIAATSCNKRVFVGMSGGVDSSVSAALLKKAGYDVTGVFIKVWQPEWLTCTWREDRRDAMRAAAHLGIPFVTLDMEKEYKEEVVDYMIAEYKAGRTPNPDVMCNRSVKFGGFYQWAMKQGADYVSTGHYARIGQRPCGMRGEGPFGARFSRIAPWVGAARKSARSAECDECPETHVPQRCYQLLVGTDPNKDQSYFLWTLTQQQLSKTIFPIGNMQKPVVRALARKFNLPNADKKDSQGLCFIGKIDVKEFLSHYIPVQKGNVLDSAGAIIGTHDGAAFYTIGERRGFTITKKTPDDEPMYVVAKDVAANTLTVSSKKRDGSLPTAQSVVQLEQVNWNQGSIPLHAPLYARSRYREELQDVRATDNSTIHFIKPQSTLSPGQSIVVYNGDICLGGGIISSK